MSPPPAIIARPSHQRQTFERNKLKSISQPFDHNDDRMLHQLVSLNRSTP